MGQNMSTRKGPFGWVQTKDTDCFAPCSELGDKTVDGGCARGVRVWMRDVLKHRPGSGPLFFFYPSPFPYGEPGERGDPTYL